MRRRDRSGGGTRGVVATGGPRQEDGRTRAVSRPVMSSMWSEAPRWNALVEYPDESVVHGTSRDLPLLWRLSRGKQAVILLGAVSLRHHYRDLLFALLLKLRRSRALIVISDATWEPRSRILSHRAPWAAPLLPALVRGFIRLIDGPNVRFCVLSTDEVDTFPRMWGVDAARVIFTPFSSTIPRDTPRSLGDYFFAGGNSLRDYPLLLAAVRGTGLRGLIRANWQPSEEALPDGIVSGQVSHEQFTRELADCRVAVFPLLISSRSAGQQSYLNAMLLEKVVIVTEAPGVRDYIQHGVTGIVVPPDPDALREAIVHAMDPANDALYESMRGAARSAVLAEFMPEIYEDCHLLGAAGFPCSDRNDSSSGQVGAGQSGKNDQRDEDGILVTAGGTRFGSEPGPQENSEDLGSAMTRSVGSVRKSEDCLGGQRDSVG